MLNTAHRFFMPALLVVLSAMLVGCGAPAATATVQATATSAATTTLATPTPTAITGSIFPTMTAIPTATLAPTLAATATAAPQTSDKAKNELTKILAAMRGVKSYAVLVTEQDDTQLQMTILLPDRISASFRTAKGERAKDNKGNILPDFIIIEQTGYYSTDGKSWAKRENISGTADALKQAQLLDLPEGTFLSLNGEKTEKGKRLGSLVVEGFGDNDTQIAGLRLRLFIEYDKETYLPTKSTAYVQPPNSSSSQLYIAQQFSNFNDPSLKVEAPKDVVAATPSPTTSPTTPPATNAAASSTMPDALKKVIVAYKNLRSYRADASTRPDKLIAGDVNATYVDETFVAPDKYKDIFTPSLIRQKTYSIAIGATSYISYDNKTWAKEPPNTDVGAEGEPPSYTIRYLLFSLADLEDFVGFQFTQLPDETFNAKKVGVVIFEGTHAGRTQKGTVRYDPQNFNLVEYEVEVHTKDDKYFSFSTTFSQHNDPSLKVEAPI